MGEVPTLERFDVRRPLGGGGISLVYEALDRDSGATIAIKTLRDVTAENVYRLKREFRLLQGLEHPNVCQHYELFEHDGRWFITMECVRGEHLLRYVRAEDDIDGQAHLDEKRLRDAMGQLADALCALHEAGLVHRDLKPSNVLVGPDGRVVLLDFGFVEDIAPRRGRDAPPDRSQSIVGTPVYMAPEQAVASDVGPAADWYAFGVMLYEALTGQLPHDGDTAIAIMMNKQRVDPPRASTLADVPPDLDALCAELLRLEPSARPHGRSVARRLGHLRTRDSRPSIASAPNVGGSFVGRREELDHLRRALRASDRTCTTTILVEGPSGIGKTVLLRQFSEEAIADGALVLAGRCIERESVPYKAFDSVIDALARYLRRLPEVEVAAILPRHPDLLVRMFPVLGAVRAFNTAPTSRVATIGEPQEQRNQAFAALREVMHRLASRRPLVVTIDDWQWADADSVVLARDLIRHRDSPPMVLVLAARPSEDSETAARIEAITTPDLQRIRVESLAEEQAVELARQLRNTFAPNLDLDLAAIARETRGHPLYISELVRYLAARGTAADPSVRLEEAILARVSELPTEARLIIEVLSVAGEPLPLDVVRDVVELDPTNVQRQSAVLRLVHLVRSGQDGALEPYHDRVRAAVLDSLDEAQRLAWHRKISFAIEATPFAQLRPELLLGHLQSAGEHAQAAEVAIAAARRAVNAGAFDQAASLMGLALRIGELDDHRARQLRIDMGHALANAGRGLESARAFLEAAETADPATRLDCHRHAAEQLLMIGEISEGVENLRKLLAEVGVKMPMTQQRALTSILWNRIKLRVRGMGWKERRASQVAPETLLRLDVLKAASHGLAMVDNVRAADFNTRWLLLALKVGERTRCTFALATEIIYQAAQGAKGTARARVLLDSVRALSTDATDPRLRAFILMAEGAVEYWACNLARADELITEAEAVFRDETTGTTLELKNTRMFVVFTLRHRGAWARLRREHEKYIAQAERCGDRYVLTSMNRYLSSLWLADDDIDGARRTVREATWVPPTNVYHVQHWYETEASAEIAIYGDTVKHEMATLEPMFRALESSLTVRLTTVKAMALGLRGRVALRLGGDDGLRGVSHAIAKMARVDNPRARVYGALLEAGRAGLKRNDELAVATLRDAIELATPLELNLHATAARYHLGTLLGGDEGKQLVSNAEARMHAETIVNARRFADWFVPGLLRD